MPTVTIGQTTYVFQGRNLTPPAFVPYRIVVSGTVRQGRKAKPAAWIAWNPDHIEPGRLPGSGCFIWAGIKAARAAALAQFDDPRVTSVQVRTNQDRTLYIWHRGNAHLLEV